MALGRSTLLYGCRLFDFQLLDGPGGCGGFIASILLIMSQKKYSPEVIYMLVEWLFLHGLFALLSLLSLPSLPFSVSFRGLASPVVSHEQTLGSSFPSFSFSSTDSSSLAIECWRGKALHWPNYYMSSSWPQQARADRITKARLSGTRIFIKPVALEGTPEEGQDFE
jgi:hypothetical protein